VSVRRTTKRQGIVLTHDNITKVCALLETGHRVTAKPRSIGGGLDVTYPVLGSQWPEKSSNAVVLWGDEIRQTDTMFEIYCGTACRSAVPRFLMPDDEAAGIRHEVWTAGIREEHRTNSGLHTHRCGCQFGKSWQCGEGQLHHKCIYGRGSEFWNRPGFETVITWPDGKAARFAEKLTTVRHKSGRTWDRHEAVVWLADRECVTRCDCPCHLDVMSRPPAPMSDTAAAWVREFVWTRRMRKVFADTPGAVLRCECQFGPSGHCNAGKHGKCWHGSNEPYLSPEGYVCGPDGTSVLSFAENFAHPTGSATGPHQTSHAMVWLTDRSCRWRCPCDCHASAGLSPEPPATPAPQIDKPVQLDLFGGAA
jgi:hypothetical protein